MKKMIIFFIIVLMMFLSTGCMARNEIENLAIAVTFGVDLTADGKYLVSTQILKASKQGSGNGKGDKPQTDVISISSEGSTIPAALDNLSKELGKKVVLSHIKFIVISEDLAKSGLSEFIDFAAREYQLHANVVILVTPGNASEILKTTTTIDPIAANAIDAILKLQIHYGYIPVITILDFFNLLGSDTASPMAGVINLHEDEQLGKTFKLTGAAIFKKDKLIGYMMDEDELYGVQWLRNKINLRNIVLPLPNQDKLTLALTSAKSTIKPMMKDNKPVIQINIDTQGNIVNMAGELDPMKHPEILVELEEIENKFIKKEIEKALYRTQKIFKADIFDFGETIHRDYPTEWKDLKENWQEVFPELEVNIEVHSSIKRTGIISKPVD